MPETTTARDLMTDAFRRIDESFTIRGAMVLLLSSEEQSWILIAVSHDGSFVGLLTPRLLLRGLLGDWATAPRDEERSETERGFREAMLEGVRGHLEDPVRDVLARDVPEVSPEETLLGLMEMISDQRLDCVPVVENGGVIGIVRSADVFHATGTLALSPGDSDDPAAE